MTLPYNILIKFQYSKHAFAFVYNQLSHFFTAEFTPLSCHINVQYAIIATFFSAELAIKSLALTFFNYNEQDLDAFWRHKKKDSKYKWSTPQQLAMNLPLSDLRRFVRREYLQPEKQLQRLVEWYDKFVVNKAMAVTLDGRHLVVGGTEGFEAFKRVWNSQIALVQRGLLSGEFTKSWQ